MKNYLIILMIIFSILFFVTASCTMAGMPLFIVGTWNVVDADIDQDDFHKLTGTSVFTSNDTYTFDGEVELTTGAKMPLEDSGQIVSVDMFQQIMVLQASQDDSPVDGVNNYNLSNNILTLENDQGSITYVKVQ